MTHRQNKRKEHWVKLSKNIHEGKAPAEWINKTARNIRMNAEAMCTHMSVESSKIAAAHIWRDGMKSKCRIKAIKKYSR